MTITRQRAEQCASHHKGRDCREYRLQEAEIALARIMPMPGRWREFASEIESRGDGLKVLANNMRHQAREIDEVLTDWRLSVRLRR